MERPRLLIVYPTPDQREPRARRIDALRHGLADQWEVFCFSDSSAGDGLFGGGIGTWRTVAPRWFRQLGAKTRAHVLVDPHEFSARRCFRTFAPVADLALLMVHPFSWAFAASRELRARGIPFVVDAGDPLTLGGTHGTHLVRGVARFRATGAERRLWETASGAIVTSRNFAHVLEREFPRLPILVRPNGYEPVTAGKISRKAETSRILRLAHFGSLYGLRIDVRPFLADLINSGLWDEVCLDQYGDIWSVGIEVPGVRTTLHRSLPWVQAIAAADAYDAALVVGNRSGLGPPSKVFAYMTLPLPRVALVANAQCDETAAYVRPFESWLVLEDGAAANAATLHAHVTRPWTQADLSPPPGEAWSAVVADIGRFLSRVLCTASRKRVADGGVGGVV
jgi:hypothetical protein